jgi:hypothetical protein
MIIELFYACMGSEFQSQEGSTQTRRIRCCPCLTEDPQNHVPNRNALRYFARPIILFLVVGS